MRLRRKKTQYVFLTIITVLYVIFPLAAQNTFEEDEKALSISDGIYENKKHFYVIRNNQPDSTVLKSFYGYWYDGQYSMESPEKEYPLVQIEDGIYLEWWHHEMLEENLDTGGIFWAPGSNVRDLAIAPYPVKEKLSGWYISGDMNLVYEIPYWKSDVTYSDDVASFRLPDGNSAYVKKFIQIGDDVYTCAAGRRKVVRNPELKDTLTGNPVYSEDGSIMVLDEPYLVKSDISNMQIEIDEHNSIRYPPHFAIAVIREPSIYKKLEDMPIEWP